MTLNKSFRWFSLVLVTGLLSACGGGSSGGETDDPPVVDDNPVVTNTAPEANAGPAQFVTTEQVVYLNGEASSDADNDPLTYHWQIVELPDNSMATLSNEDQMVSNFTPDVAGNYNIQLVVNDGSVESAASDVSITVSQAVNLTSYAIVDTGQTRCFDSTSGVEGACIELGYDADIETNFPSYQASQDGLLVEDLVTGLVWQQSSDVNGDGQLTYSDKLSYEQAIDYCDNLSYGGRVDWRLPSLKQAFSLILFSGKDASNYQGTDTTSLTPFLADIFDWAFGDIITSEGIAAGDRIIDGQYATSTLYTGNTMQGDDTAFGVNYVDGRIKGYPKDRKRFYVRCVTENPSYGDNDFIEEVDGTVTDKNTTLMWQKNDVVDFNWQEAVDYCASANTAGFNDWRLPNIKELHSIVDYQRGPQATASASIDPVFSVSNIINEAGELDWGYYWSSTTHVDNNDNGSNAAYIAFGRALGYFNQKLLDVHGAGSQRSNAKLSLTNVPGVQTANVNGNDFSYKGPQGDILRIENMVRCVRDAEATSEDAQPRNILLIIGDDIGVDNVSGYREQPNHTAQTPTIDALAQSGVLFRNAWANPKCSPSRASILTGKHATYHGVTHPGGLTGKLATEQVTIAEVLKLEGYDTALFGKWHLGHEAGLYPSDQGFDHFSGSVGNISNYYDWEKTQILATDGLVSSVQETGYATEVNAMEAADWINLRSPQQPWFVTLAFNAPHSPYQVPPKDKFSGVTLSGEQGAFCNDDASLDAVADCYRAMAESMDSYISALLNRMSSETLANTLIVFIGDNGTPKDSIIVEDGLPFSKAHSKGTVYEGGVNVPLVISGGSGLKLVAAEVADLVQAQDLFNTLVDFAGADYVDDSLNSQSLAGYLTNQFSRPSPRTNLFTELTSETQGIDRWAITNGQAKYIYNEGAEECYNLTADPGETSNKYNNNDNAIVSVCNEIKLLKPQ